MWLCYINAKPKSTDHRGKSPYDPPFYWGGGVK